MMIPPLSTDPPCTNIGFPPLLLPPAIAWEPQAKHSHKTALLLRSPFQSSTTALHAAMLAGIPSAPLLEWRAGGLVNGFTSPLPFLE